jgi:hypothetical protein
MLKHHHSSYGTRQVEALYPAGGVACCDKGRLA